MSHTAYYRIHTGDPSELLDPSRWTSSLWVGEAVRACDACDNGRVWVADDSDEGGYEARCDVCDGLGEIDDTTRRGVSVCGSYADLMGYFAGRGATIREATVLVELDGRLSEDEDWDSRAGAILIYPTSIISSRPLTADEITTITEAH